MPRNPIRLDLANVEVSKLNVSKLDLSRAELDVSKLDLSQVDAISKLVAARTNPDLAHQIDRSDLAFIDAAIAMHRALQLNPGGPSVGGSNPAGCETIEWAILAVDLAVVAYKVYNSCNIDANPETFAVAEKLGANSSLNVLIAVRDSMAQQGSGSMTSLAEMVAARDKLAQELGE